MKYKLYLRKWTCIQHESMNKSYIQHDMDYGRSNDLSKRTQSDKVMRDKAFKLSSDPKHDGY